MSLSIGNREPGEDVRTRRACRPFAEARAGTTGLRAECTDAPREVCELALAHVNRTGRRRVPVHRPVRPAPARDERPGRVRRLAEPAFATLEVDAAPEPDRGSVGSVSIESRGVTVRLDGDIGAGRIAKIASLPRALR